jgi:hypothetical protein
LGRSDASKGVDFVDFDTGSDASSDSGSGLVIFDTGSDASSDSGSGLVISAAAPTPLRLRHSSDSDTA